MDIEEELKKILFKIGQEIKIHKIDSDNSVIEIDYDRYTVEILRLLFKYLNE